MTERDKLIDEIYRLHDKQDQDELTGKSYEEYIADFILADRKDVLERVRNPLNISKICSSIPMIFECIDEALSEIDRAVKTMERLGMNKIYQQEILDFIDELKRKDISANVAAQVAAILYAGEMAICYPKPIS